VRDSGGIEEGGFLEVRVRDRERERRERSDWSRKYG
jgi:hypothetical protein